MALGYLIGPLALVVILVLMHFRVVVREPTWLWIAVFALVPTTSMMTDHLYRLRPSAAMLSLRVVQNVAAVVVVTYLTGWGPVLVLAFAFVALENISRDGSHLWRACALWSLLAIAAGQAALSAGWAPSVLSISHANELALMAAFVLVFVIRMAGAVMEQKETAEAQMSRNEDRFRSLIQNSSDVTMVVSEGICTYVSPSVTPMLGFKPSELVGRRWAEFVDDEDEALVAERVRSGSPTAADGVAVQFHMQTKDGTFRLVEAVVADQRTRPSVAGFVASIRDITERTKAASELKSSQESFRALFEQHPHPMWVYDLETLRFLEVNQCATECYGYSREEFFSMTIADIRPEEDAWRLMNYLRTERPNLNYAGTWRHRTSSGEIIDVEVTTHALEFRGRRGGLVMAQDITERLRLERQLRDHALHDPLTGLPNRSLLLDRVQRLNAQAKGSSGTEVTVLCLDLDNLKMINETYGHDVGDAIICQVAERLVNSLPDADTVARTEGHEFVILAVSAPLGAAPTATATDTAERILGLIGSEPFEVKGHTLSVESSIGVVAGTCDYGEELIEHAGTASKLAKAEGGSRYVVFTRDMQQAVDERHQLMIGLHAPLGTSQFENFYQPVVRLVDLSVTGVEALVRWRHPTFGMVPPHRFISLAEETGMITELGRYVMRQACEQAKAWQFAERKLTVAVNVSVFQLRSDEFIADVRDALESSGLEPNRLVLEVTESILINNPQSAMSRLSALKDLGVRLAIDDFGTGYSSLSYLGQLPFDILKIDQSFVASMLGSPQAMTMVRTMIQLGRQLRLEVIAEGVESEPQLDLLRRLHCHNAQGYMFAPPLDAAAVTLYLRDRSANATQEIGGSSSTRVPLALPRTSIVTPRLEAKTLRAR